MPWRPAILALALLVASGCTGNGGASTTLPATETTTDAPAPPPVPPPRFAATLVDANRTGHEPTVVVTRAGTLLVHARGVAHGVAAGDPQSFNRLWRAANGTFEPVGNPEMHDAVASEGHIAVLDTGRVLAAYSRMDGPATGTGGVELLGRVIDVHASDDDGRTWRRLAVLQMPSVHRTWLWPGDGATVHLGALSYGPTFHWASTDGGATWSMPERVYDYNTYNGRLAGSRNTLLWPWFTGLYEQTPGEGERLVGWALDAVVRTEPGAWVPHRITALEGNRGSVFAGATADDAGTLYVTWSTWSPGASHVAYAHSADGVTWSAPVVVSEGAGLRLLPAVDAVGVGQLHLAWYRNDGFAEDPLNATGGWYVDLATVTDASGPLPGILVEPAWPDPLLEGPLCIQALTCGDVVRGDGLCIHPLPAPDCHDLDHVRYYDDFLGLAHDAQGRAVVAAVATHGFGLPEWVPGEPGHPVVIRQLTS